MGIAVVRAKIVELATKIRCENILSENVCNKMRKIAASLKIKFEKVMTYMKNLVVKGITKAKEIAEIVRAKIIEMATNFKCEDALSADVCAKMREVAAKLKVDFAKV